MARTVLRRGVSVVMEGMLPPDRYGEMLLALDRDHAGTTLAYFWDLPFEETLRRHATKTRAAELGETEMRSWWCGRALVPGLAEELLDGVDDADAVVARIVDACRR